jgi:hypothetical protein
VLIAVLVVDLFSKNGFAGVVVAFLNSTDLEEVRQELEDA